jgi:hypothetical protein
VARGLTQQAGAVLARFGVETGRLAPLSGGHINRSWRVRQGGEPGFLLQRINPEVFRDGGAVVRNVTLVTDHLWRAATRTGIADPERRVLRLARTPEGEPAVQGPDGAWWRLLHYIPHTRALVRVSQPGEAREVGRAFGRFQRLLADYGGPVLVETIPGFHDTSRRLESLEAAAARDAAGRARAVAAELAFARSRTEYAAILPPLLQSGEVRVRVVHNDAKCSNVLLDRNTGEGLAVVDLDTVMPGTLLYDVGDLIRSAASPTDEDERDRHRIAVVPELVEALLRGFLDECGDTAVDTERALFVLAGILIAWEQGIRFLTDYLEGDAYYRTSRPDQNLDRCRAQFRLVEGLEAERAGLERMLGASLKGAKGKA